MLTRARKTLETLLLVATLGAPALLESQQPYKNVRAVSSVSAKPVSRPSKKKRVPMPSPPGLTVYGTREDTLPNGLRLSYIYTIPEQTMTALGLWLRTQPTANWDIEPASPGQFTKGTIHTGEGSSVREDLIKLQRGGKAHFYNPPGDDQPVYVLVPLTFTANGAGDALINGVPRPALSSVQMENFGHNDAAILRGEPCLDDYQYVRDSLLIDYLVKEKGVSRDSIFTHGEIRVRFLDRKLRYQINKGLVDSLPEKRVAKGDNRFDGSCIDFKRLGLPDDRHELDPVRVERNVRYWSMYERAKQQFPLFRYARLPPLHIIVPTLSAFPTENSFSQPISIRAPTIVP